MANSQLLDTLMKIKVNLAVDNMWHATARQRRPTPAAFSLAIFIKYLRGAKNKRKSYFNKSMCRRRQLLPLCFVCNTHIQRQAFNCLCECGRVTSAWYSYFAWKLHQFINRRIGRAHNHGCHIWQMDAPSQAYQPHQCSDSGNYLLTYVCASYAVWLLV